MLLPTSSLGGNLEGVVQFAMVEDDLPWIHGSAHKKNEKALGSNQVLQCLSQNGLYNNSKENIRMEFTLFWSVSSESGDCWLWFPIWLVSSQSGDCLLPSFYVHIHDSKADHCLLPRNEHRPPNSQ